MYEDVLKIINEYESQGDFTHVVVRDDVLSNAETVLNINIPEQYRWFLKNYGHGGIGGIETLGMGKNGRIIFVDETIKYRSYGLPNELIMIENCDEWIYCINTRNEKIVMWSHGREKYDFAYENFLAYLKDRMNDAIENI